MAIPGYDPDDIAEVTLERDVESDEASASVVASHVPEAFTLVESERESPPGALSDPVELYALEDLEGLDALKVTLAYDPSGLPPGASPTDVAIAVEAEEPGEFETVDSSVDLEETTVSAVLNELPTGNTVVAVTTHDSGTPSG